MSGAPYRKYCCDYCGMIYDEELGLPDDDLPPGTRYKDIPEDWYCPQCGTEKSGLVLIKV